MTKIIRIFGREVLDSRGNPALEGVICTKKFCEQSIVPSGASKGSREALELRDGGKRYNGMGVLNAVNNLKVIEKELINANCKKQSFIDKKMIKLDGTENKSNLGANAILSVSMSCARLGARHSNIELYEYLAMLFWGKFGEDYKNKIKIPMPYSNVINGGKHAGNNLEIQEFMITPLKAKSFREATQIVSEVYHSLKSILLDKYGKSATNVGDEGGFAPQLKDNEEALELLMFAIQSAGYEDKVRLAVDAAASSFYDKDSKRYLINGKRINREELLDYYLELINKYPIISLEDPFDENDFNGFVEITKKLGSKIQIVGDDLLVTNVKRIKMAARRKLCNALLLKINQIGTVTESFKAAKLAFDNNWKVMVSHRSGETEDTFISDLAVALGCGQIKIGAPCRGERTCKYNRLLRIEEMLHKE
ncbi:MAG: phosphopyruvate hydratase [Candidatus Woesearchaeota archaeon]